jgi:RNA polymerase sigma-70 factor, ECF subfamily
MEIEKLVKKAKKGNDKAFQLLIEHEKEKLYRLAFLYTKNEEDALEVVHETVYKAYVSIEKLKNDSYFTTWLVRILINCSNDFFRKKQRVVSINDKHIESFPSHDQQIELQLDMKNIINELENKYKTVIFLKYYQDLTVEQIAETLEWPIGTVKSTLSRALSKLRTELKGDCINE